MERTLSAVLIWTLWTENCWSQQVTHSSVMHGLSGSTHRWFPLRICSSNATLIFVSFSWDPFFSCQFVITPRKVYVWQDGWPWTHLDLWQLLLQNCSCSSIVPLSCMRCSQFPEDAVASLQLQFSLHLVWGLIMSSAHASVTIVVAGMLLLCSLKGSAKGLSPKSDFISLETARGSVYLPHCLGSGKPGSTTMAGTVSHGASAPSGLCCGRIYFLNAHSTSH